MKKILVLIFFLCFPFFVSAYSKEDIVSLVKNQTVCDQETENMYQTYFNAYSKIIDAKEINESLANTLYKNLSQVLNTIKENNICSINDLDKIDSKVKDYIYDTLFSSSKLLFSAPNLPKKNTNITYNSDSTIDIYEDGKLVDKLELNLKKFNYVGFPKEVIIGKYVLLFLTVLFIVLLFIKKNKKFVFKNSFIIIISLNVILLSIYYMFGSKIYEMYSLVKTMSIIESSPLAEIKVDNQKILSKPNYGSTYGTLTINDLDIKLPIIYGDSKEILKKGIGHTNLSGLPGEGKNIIYSSHNSKNLLHNLKNINTNDLIKIETSYGIFEYQVLKTEILNENEYNKLSSASKETLILYTCYPFDELIYSKTRLVVYATLIEARWS